MNLFQRYSTRIVQTIITLAIMAVSITGAAVILIVTWALLKGAL